MDAEVIGIPPAGVSPQQLDLFVPSAATGSHVVPILTGVDEDKQQAQVLCAMYKDSIPQLPGIGPDWVGFLTKAVSFPELDGQIRANLAAGGHADYYPTYDVVDDGLTVAATNQGSPGGG